MFYLRCLSPFHKLQLMHEISRSLWPRSLRRGSADARLLRWWFRTPSGGMDVCLLRVLCVVRYRSLRRVDHKSRGVLPNAVRRYV
jgi:hypothetical protein